MCCSRTGCYSDDPPFDHLPLPMCPEQVNPDYYHYTRESQGKPEHFNYTTVPYDLFYDFIINIFIFFIYFSCNAGPHRK